jgi:septal ring factor EnvC (AmiA/AmiB activator)
MGLASRRRLLLGLAVVGALLAGATILVERAAPSAAAGIGQLTSQLGSDQAHQHDLQSSIASLDTTIDSLDSQISLVDQREATVTDALDAERTRLTEVKQQLAAQRTRLVTLRRRLADARGLLGAQLRSEYETARPDLMTVVLQAHGFDELLDQLDFLGRAEHEQQALIDATASAKHQAHAAATRLAALRQTDARVTNEEQIRVRALAGMNALLQSRQAAIARARSAQADALAASRADAARLQQRISSIEAARRARARRAAAARAAAAAAAAQQAETAEPTVPTALGPSGDWSIPYAIVLCESGGQNLPPNSAGASGYYQIIPSTWTLFGGSGPAAYLAPKSEQDAVASRIWDGGAGAHNWVCAGIVGID